MSISKLICYTEHPWKVKFIKLSKKTLPNFLKEISSNVHFKTFFDIGPIKLYGNKGMAKKKSDFTMTSQVWTCFQWYLLSAFFQTYKNVHLFPNTHPIWYRQCKLLNE